MALIKCPDCGTDVSNAAPACPKCGRPIAAAKSAPPQKKTSGCAVVVLAIIILAAIGAIFGHGDDSSSSASTGSSAPTTQAAPPTPRKVTKVTADQLFNAYNNNEVATDEALKGTDVEVTGRVQEVAKDFTDSIVISLATSNEFMPARMNMEDSEKGQSIKLRPGNTVSIVCHDMHRIVGSPAGTKCVFADADVPNQSK